MSLGQELPVMETFFSIQGEGYYQGAAAYFVRLGGCDVGCVWCDVKESWDVHQHELVSCTNIVDQVVKSNCNKVIITGGEPAMYVLDDLTQQLRELGIKTHIETSGVYPLTGTWDWVCYSPKKFKKPDTTVPSKAHELKIVVYSPSDFEWAEMHAKTVSPDCLLYLQPEWSKREIITPLIVSYIQSHPQWKLSLQIHKYIGVP